MFGFFSWKVKTGKCRYFFFLFLCDHRQVTLRLGASVSLLLPTFCMVVQIRWQRREEMVLKSSLPCTQGRDGFW